MTDRLERLTNLVANLLDARRPLPLDDILDAVPGYPPDRESARRQFQRDKEILTGIGIPVSVEPIDPLVPGGTVGYRVRPDEYYLPDLDLTPEERAALHVAVTAVRLEGDGARSALFKLGGIEGESAVTLAALPAGKALPVLFDAYRRRARVTFGYRDETRQLDPYGLLLRRGRWYVVGFDHDRGGERSFRVDRIDGEVEVGPPGTFEPPTGVDPASLLRDDPLAFGDEAPVDARLLVDRGAAATTVDELGEEAVIERRDDSAVVFSVPVANRDAFRSFVLGWLDRAEVLGPPDLRAELVSWLEAIIEGAR